MWTHPLTIALVAVGSSLLTIILTPLLQHHFWRYRARDDLRLGAIKEFNRLTAEYITGVLFGAPPPGHQWLAALNTASSDIQALFSKEAFRAIQSVDELIGRGPQRNERADRFADARDAALRALYGEVIPAP